MQKLIIAGLTGTLLLACGDDNKAEPIEDSGAPIPTMDSGPTEADAAEPEPEPIETLVTNTGAPCKDRSDCKGGPMAICTTVLELPDVGGLTGGGGADTEPPPPIEWEGGYCGALCSHDEECGEGAGCIGLALVETLGPLADGFGGIDGILGTVGLMPTCGKLCGDVSDCREGYQCSKLLDAFDVGIGAFSGFLGGSAPKFCLPVVPEPEPPVMQDGGVDGGDETDAGDTDAGDTDASTDAGDTDAGTDAGDAGTDAGDAGTDASVETATE